MIQDKTKKSQRYKINSSNFKDKELTAFQLGYMTAIMDLENKK